jgi:uncharacterized membrane protein
LISLAFALSAFSPLNYRGSQPLQSTPETLPDQPVVRVIMFWMDGCPHCHEVINDVLPVLQERYGNQLEIRLIEVVDVKDVDYLLAVANAYGIPNDQAGVPLLIIGDYALSGSQEIPTKLPGLIDSYLAQGGVDWPAAANLSGAAAATGKQETLSEVQSEGFSIAIAVLALMAAALIYSMIAFTLGKAPSMPGWSDWLFPLLILTGLGVAGYLSYVEIQMVDAVCGPVGDCNSVQSSPYARVFGILPVGVLGMTGYIAILAAWMIQRWASGRRVAMAALAVFAMALMGVVFSLYLTYLEPFVIKAVCMWCISSAVIMTLLLLLSTPAAIEALYKLKLRRQTARTVRKTYVQKKK